MYYENDEPIVKVHVAATDVPFTQKRKPTRTVWQTVVLTSAEQVKPILPESDRRVVAYVQALDNDIVLVSSIGQGQNASNTATNVPFPSGCYLQKANTAPYPVYGQDQVFAAATTTGSNTRVAVQAIYEEE